jgi:hypothetical protein
MPHWCKLVHSNKLAVVHSARKLLLMKIQPLELVWPAAKYLSGYVQALDQGRSPDNLRPEAAAEELERIAADPARFLSEQVDREATRTRRACFAT